MAPKNLASNIQPDPIDFRDRGYNPTLLALEPEFNFEPFKDPSQIGRVKDQGKSNACTGFALSAMAEILLDEESRLKSVASIPKLGRISPYMLYFARRYDEIPGDPGTDAGSSARGAMKAWQKHGACEVRAWPNIQPPDNRDWIGDAFVKPLGAYYRVDHTSLSDMHAAINETGVLYVTAAIHSGWETTDKQGRIKFSRLNGILGGHAFLIVGYDRCGFWIQNSWNQNWGKKGFGHLCYGDWNEHGWDSWVAQAGVQTSVYLETIASGLSTKYLKGAASVAKKDPTLYARALLSSIEEISAQQINPYVIDLENNGTLSAAGSFTTTKQDLQLFTDHYIPAAISDFGLGSRDPVDIAIYAHGGLTDEKGAADTARVWIPALHANRIIPLFIMWETGLWETLGDIIKDASGANEPVPAGGFFGDLKDKMFNFLDDRLEGLAAKPGTAVWGEMKQNATAASQNKNGGLRLLYQIFAESTQASLLRRFRFHLIGHSAGSIFHAYLLPALVGAGLKVDGLYFMAPAARLDLFASNIFPLYQSGAVPCYTEFYLDDQTEQNDTCIDIYHKSLLYLVSNAFERKRGTPLLGMEKFLAPDLLATKPSKKTAVWDWIASPAGKTARPGFRTNSSSHGGFGTEPQTMASILQRINARR